MSDTKTKPKPAAKKATKKPAAKKAPRAPKKKPAASSPAKQNGVRPVTVDAEKTFLPAMELKPGISLEEWGELAWVQRNAEVANWWVGDWILFGEEQFGEECYQFADHTLDHTRLPILGQVARSFPKEVRRPFDLSWDHHRQIAQSVEEHPDRLKWLDRAVKEKLSVSELGRTIREETAIEAASAPVKGIDPPATVKYRVEFTTNLGNREAIQAVLEKMANRGRFDLEKVPGVEVVDYSVPNVQHP